MATSNKQTIPSRNNASGHQVTYHNKQNLTQLKSQLRHLSASQLRDLRGAINAQLDDLTPVSLTDAEQRFINSLF